MEHSYSASDVARHFASYDRLKHAPNLAHKFDMFFVLFQRYLQHPATRVCALLRNKVGMTFVSDHSGNCFKRKGGTPVTLQDRELNREVSSDRSRNEETL